MPQEHAPLVLYAGAVSPVLLPERGCLPAPASYRPLTCTRAQSCSMLLAPVPQPPALAPSGLRLMLCVESLTLCGTKCTWAGHSHNRPGSLPHSFSASTQHQLCPATAAAIHSFGSAPVGLHACPRSTETSV